MDLYSDLGSADDLLHIEQYLALLSEFALAHRAQSRRNARAGGPRVRSAFLDPHDPGRPARHIATTDPHYGGH